MDMEHRVTTSQLALGALFAIGIAFAAGCSPDYPKCDTDSDCHEKEFCVNGMCQQCRGDQDCPAGQTCAAGACEAIQGYCTTSSDCAEGQECQNNMCVSVAESSLAPPPPSMDTGCELQSVYFGYDSSSLEDSARAQLGNNAQCIKQKGVSALHLTGLTDPRGTEEYNLALGDRRAQSAQKYLQSLGVETQLSYSSMGEETATGTDEGSWARDRRVDLSPR
jgi:peptidoglycan-associated lipoprotein